MIVKYGVNIFIKKRRLDKDYTYKHIKVISMIHSTDFSDV